MKAGWHLKTLGDYFDITSSKRVFKDEWTTEGVPFYRAREIVRLARDGVVDNELYISRERFETYKRKYGVPSCGDILVTGVGTLGICHVVRPDDEFYFKDGNIIWLQKKTEIDSRFVEYAFKSNFLRDQIDDSVGATVGTYTIIKAKGTKIPIPPLDEQQRIVAVLDKAFVGIATCTVNAQKNLTNARALFEGYLQFILTERGEKWAEYSFDQICSISSKLVDPRLPDYIDLPHIGAGNMASRTGGIIDVLTAREEGLKSGKFLFDNSMVLYSKIRPYLMKACRPDFSGLCSADVYPLVPKANLLDRDMLFHILMSDDFTAYAEAGSARAGMPKVNRDHLFKYSVWLPDVKTQRAICKNLDDLATKCQKLTAKTKRKLTALSDLKQSLLQQAFAGELT